MTVGSLRPVMRTRSEVVSAAFTSASTAVAVSWLSASSPASGATYFSMYIRIVAPEEPVPVQRGGGGGEEVSRYHIQMPMPTQGEM